MKFIKTMTIYAVIVVDKKNSVIKLNKTLHFIGH